MSIDRRTMMLGVAVIQLLFVPITVMILGYGPAWFYATAAVSIGCYLLDGLHYRVWNGATVFALIAGLVDIANGSFYLPMDDYGIPVSIFASALAHLIATLAAVLGAMFPPPSVVKHSPQRGGNRL